MKKTIPDHVALGMVNKILDESRLGPSPRMPHNIPGTGRRCMYFAETECPKCGWVYEHLTPIPVKTYEVKASIFIKVKAESEADAIERVRSLSFQSTHGGVYVADDLSAIEDTEPEA